MEEKRSSFTGKIGFVLAAAGSAVGLGNIWRFPYLAAKYGGGIFLLVYLVFALTFGFALMCAEIAIGRKTGKSAIDAYGSLNKKYSFIGVLGAIIPMMILPYYSVIGGWVTKYLAMFVSGGAAKTATDVAEGVSFFDSFVTSPGEPIIWFLIFMAATALIVFFGVEKGVEKVSKIMMPVLVVLTLFIAIYSLFIPGAIEGVKYYLIPNFENFSATTVLAALGQLFYSMSLAMGIMITYGSYMKKDINLEKSVSQIEFFDTAIAFLAGLMIIPAVFAFNPEKIGKGPGLMFETLPEVFEFMPGGAIIGMVFFVLVLFAALTSSISLMETVVSIFRDKFGWKRSTTCALVLTGCIIIGIPVCLGFNLLDFIKIGSMGLLDIFDFTSNNILMPIVALLTCIFVGYIIKPQAVIEEIELNGKFKRKKIFIVLIKYIAPICILLILISSCLDALGIMKI